MEENSVSQSSNSSSDEGAFEGSSKLSKSKELERIIDELTSTGRSSLSPELLKRFKQIVRQSDRYIRTAFSALMKKLRQAHAEIRLSAFQICAFLFDRSVCFRVLLMDDLKGFLQLTAEIEPFESRLPPPKHAAEKLKTLSMGKLEEWKSKYAEEHPVLAIAWRYLISKKKVVSNSTGGALPRAEKSDEKRTRRVRQKKSK